MLVHFANSGFIAKPTCGGDAPRDRSDYFHLAAIISSSFVTLAVTRACVSVSVANVTEMVQFLKCISKTRVEGENSYLSLGAILTEKYDCRSKQQVR